MPKSQGLLEEGLLVSCTALPQNPLTPSHLFPASFTWGQQCLPVGAFIDSGADENFLDGAFAQQAGITLVPLDNNLETRALNGRALYCMAYTTEPLRLTASGNHVEMIHFFVFTTPSFLLVLG